MDLVLQFQYCGNCMITTFPMAADDVASLRDNLDRFPVAIGPFGTAEVPRELRELAAAAAARVLAAPGAAPSGAQLARLSALLEVTLLPRSAGSVLVRFGFRPVASRLRERGESPNLIVFKEKKVTHR